MRFPSRSSWHRLRFRLPSRRFLLIRRALAVGLLLLAAALALRPAAAPATSAEPARMRAGPAIPLSGVPGLSTVPVHLADASVASLLSPGMRVDVVAADDGYSARKVLASMATVVDIRSPPESASRLTGTESKGPLVLIAVPAGIAPEVAAMSLRNPVAVTLR